MTAQGHPTAQPHAYTWPDSAVLGELKRELAMRESVYPRQVELGRMSQTLMDRRIEIIQQLIAEYEQRVLGEDLFG